jgi:DNA topoisomerase II
VENVLELAQHKASKALKKTDGKKVGYLKVPKLEDATLAGTKQSDQCTIIFTEGDSAKALAMAGLSVVGRKTYGVFPLRGKVVNVRESNMSAIEKNVEFANIKKILGLKVRALCAVLCCAALCPCPCNVHRCALTQCPCARVSCVGATERRRVH